MDLAVPQDKIGDLITDSVKALLGSRRRLQGRFTDTDDDYGANAGHGPFTSMQGIRSVLGAFVALAEDERTDIWQAVEPDLQSIFEEWTEVLRELGDGYDARPYDLRNALYHILREGAPRSASAVGYYVDTLSWAVSTAVLFNYAARILQSQGRSSPASDLLDSNRQQLGRALTMLLDAQCEDGGWGWVRGADAGHLYFTWSTVQGLADFYDYVLGESQSQIGIPADHEVVAWLAAHHPDLRSRVDAARQRALEFLVRRYLTKALEQGLELEDLTIEKRLEPRDRRHSRVVVYYELYLLESLILLGYDAPGGVLSTRKRANTAQLFRRITERFDELRSLSRSDDSFWSDPDASTLRFEIISKKPSQGVLHKFLAQDPGLWAQFLRTMILYRFYVDPGEGYDGKIVGTQESALHFLVDDRREDGPEIGDGLWDSLAFNLSITSRSIEALIDVYDYYQRLEEKEAVTPRLATGDLAAILADAVYPHLSSRLQAVAPAQQEAPTEEIDTAGLRKDLLSSMRKGSFQRLKEHFADAVAPLKEWGGPERDQLLEEFLGKTAVHQLQHDNSDAHDLLGKLVWLNFCIGVRLLPLVLAESAIFHFAEGEDVTHFRQVEADPATGHQKLADRFKLALQELMAHEVSAAERRPDDPPSYRELVQSLFAQASSSKGRTR